MIMMMMMMMMMMILYCHLILTATDMKDTEKQYRPETGAVNIPVKGA
jgi:hypothetical protein